MLSVTAAAGNRILQRAVPRRRAYAPACGWFLSVEGHGYSANEPNSTDPNSPIRNGSVTGRSL